MDFTLSEPERELVGLCRDFAQGEIAPRAPVAWEEARCPTDLLREMGALGLLGMLIPEEWGGIGMSTVGFVAAMEQIGLADQSVAAAWQAHVTIGSLPLYLFGDDAQRERWLRPLAEGTALGAFGLTEPDAGSDARGITTRAELPRRRLGDQRPQDLHLERRDGHVVRRDPAGPHRRRRPTAPGRGALAGSFVVEKDTPGFSMGPKMRGIGWRGLDTRALFFDDVWVPADQLVGDAGMGLSQFLRTLEVGRISIAALSLSLTQAVLDLATDYARQRVQFGQPISKFQAVQFKLADIATELEAARWLTYRAASLRDAGQPFLKEAAMAKLKASRLAVWAASEAVQIHGGSATCSTRPWRGSTAMPRCSRSARGPTRSSTRSSPAPSAAELAEATSTERRPRAAALLWTDRVACTSVTPLTRPTPRGLSDAERSRRFSRRVVGILEWVHASHASVAVRGCRCEPTRRLLARFITPGSRVLEIGAGRGASPLTLRPVAGDVAVASDISPCAARAQRGRVSLRAGVESAVEGRVVLDVVDLSSIDDASFDARSWCSAGRCLTRSTLPRRRCKGASGSAGRLGNGARQRDVARGLAARAPVGGRRRDVGVRRRDDRHHGSDRRTATRADISAESFREAKIEAMVRRLPCDTDGSVSLQCRSRPATAHVLRPSSGMRSAGRTCWTGEEGAAPRSRVRWTRARTSSSQCEGRDRDSAGSTCPKPR